MRGSERALNKYGKKKRKHKRREKTRSGEGKKGEDRLVNGPRKKR